MKRIYKYEILNELELPKEAEILDFQTQGDTLCLWALVDPEAPKQTRTFRVIGTGYGVEEDLSYVGTSQQGPFVWHLFEANASA